MDHILGKRINQLDLSLKKMGDLVYQEGPIFSHFINENKEDYFYYWVDSNEELNRWMLISPNTQLLIDFFSEKITWKELIKNVERGEVYIIDIDKNLNYKSIFIVKIADIPSKYFPPNDSYFDEELYEPYALELKGSLTAKMSQKVKTYKTEKPHPTMATEPEAPKYRKPK